MNGDSQAGDDAPDESVSVNVCEEEKDVGVLGGLGEVLIGMISFLSSFS